MFRCDGETPKIEDKSNPESKLSSVMFRGSLMDDVYLSTARHFRYELRLPAENFQQQFGARKVQCASQDIILQVQVII